MTAIVPATLQAIRERIWFYEFELPDGSRTRCDLPEEMRPIHSTRQRQLLRVIEERIRNPASKSALDFASHEGFFSFEMAKHFGFVRGLEFRSESLAAARLMAGALGITNVEFQAADLQHMSFDERLCADFVMVFGLIYHLENPIHALRLASQLCRGHILIETQVLPYDITGRVEFARYDHHRPVNGVFALVPDSPASREGGSTHFALVPSLNTLLHLLRSFDFKHVEVLAPQKDDYEQYQRGSRVIVYGRRVPPTSHLDGPLELRHD